MRKDLLFTVDMNFVELVQHCFRKSRSSGLCDIYDGEIYKESTFFDSVYNISLTLNFDGAPKFKFSDLAYYK